MIRHLNNIPPTATSHGVGEKRVLLASNESGCSLAQIAVTQLKAGEVAQAHIHPDMQEGFYVLEGQLKVILDEQETLCQANDFVYVDKCTSHEMQAITDSRILTIGCVIEASRNKLYPMLFKQNRKTLVWGTEDWTVSAVPNSESEVENGTWARYKLSEVIARRPQEILGKKVAQRYNNQLPLLTKIIDAHDDLSIQVHPNDEMARREHNKFGKSEMWYILDAQPGACLYAGFKQHITPQEYKQLVEAAQNLNNKVVKENPSNPLDSCSPTNATDQSEFSNSQSSIEPVESIRDNNKKTILDVLAKHEVHPGDVFYLPSGRVHAICGGIKLAEVQQSSDITYRIYDYNRPGLDGCPRELHTQLASQAIDYTVYDEYKTDYQENHDKANLLLNTPYFSIKVIDATEPFHRNMVKYDSFIIIMNLEGDCKIRVSSTKDEIHLPEGISCLIPAAIADYYIIPTDGHTKILETFINNKKSIGKLISDFFYL